MQQGGQMDATCDIQQGYVRLHVVLRYFATEDQDTVTGWNVASNSAIKYNKLSLFANTYIM